MKFKFECPDCGRVEYIDNPISVRIKCSAECLMDVFSWDRAENTDLSLLRQALFEDLRLDWIKDSKPKRGLISEEGEIITLKKGKDLVTLTYQPSMERVIVKLNGQEQIIYPAKILGNKIRVYRQGMMIAISVPVR